MRGSLARLRVGHVADGSIPACAGEPSRTSSVTSATWVYPRVVRGSPAVRPVPRRPRGSIPACAGEPVIDWPSGISYSVYPRVCGGALTAREAADREGGLSPRVRGSPEEISASMSAFGSIPACAGEPPCRSMSTRAAWVYPRVCGGARFGPMPLAPAMGLSPRVRGSPLQLDDGRPVIGSIPACAGEPRWIRRLDRPHRVYPRVCGGADASSRLQTARRGLSPRVRGSPAPQVAHERRPGSIPACAGEPRSCARTGRGSGVYPRVCGGAPTTAVCRGRCTGSIPACAGEPQPARPRGRARRVYPRVCGGAPTPVGVASRIAGLSPRVRGSRVRVLRPRAGEGSIPACAGEPAIDGTLKPVCGVYPRVCGGALASVIGTGAGGGSIPACAGEPPRPPGGRGRVRGLSPRVRGSRDAVSRPDHRDGSIPACAGEPSRGWPRRITSRVYPRVCGGARASHRAGRVHQGLSPRVRGSPPDREAHVGHAGSIPACAGEPLTTTAARYPSRVYPRVCGGALPDGRRRRDLPGLSPRVRGSPSCGSSRDRPSRSIPACAGEPPRRGPPTVSTMGLSPRVRGSRCDRHRRRCWRGSIPACAGEPPRRPARRGSSWVYPRVCGGAVLVHRALLDGPGLSPRVRGSRSLHEARRGGPRSIPACAGEPASAPATVGGRRVYPRVCGGATGMRGVYPRVCGGAAGKVGGARFGSIPACAGEPRSS